MKKRQPAKRGEGIDPVDEAVGEAIKNRRAFLGMSQEKLADKIGRTFQQIQKYERGTNRVAASTLFYIGLALDVPVSFFFERLSQSGNSTDMPDLSNDEIKLVKTYREAGDKKQRFLILSIIRRIVKIQNG